ncbi:MAG: S-methyl-5'-thioadenosine phosphorylase [Thermomicrobiales bacterium]|nr:S-methyl-5'-thioadenosine phosphorylase [Thermomicrobiales bacterium]
MRVLGVIGGSGLYDIPDLEILERATVSTPWGEPSDQLTLGRIGGNDVVFLPRHGAGHRLQPTDLPYQANIYALKQAGVTHLLTVSAVGSLREDLPPETIVLPDQIIDRTVSRPRSFFGEGVVAHVGIAEPYCTDFGSHVLAAAARAGQPVATGGTYVCIEGPQFSTKAESHLFRSWGCSVIGMTAMPEARLAREAELCYSTLAMVTDYDVWHASEAAVSVELVGKHLRKNAAAGRAIVTELVRSWSSLDRACGCGDALANTIVTDPALIPAPTRRRLGLIADRYLPPAPPDA